MNLSGIDVTTGAAVRLSMDKTITAAEELITQPEDAPYLAPGFIDLQVNGFAGCDYNSGKTSHESIAHSLQAQFATGVTRLYPTVITGPAEEMLSSLRNLANARETLPHGRAMEGFHIEGPHISPDDGPRGAHPKQCVRPPDVEEYKRWQEAARGNVRLVTLSPEWPEATRYIDALVSDGVVISIGHTKATSEQIADAVSAGATKSTHLGNGAHDTVRRHPNYIWDQLADDRLAAGFIVDGIHLPAAFLKVALRAKGIERSILVTDAVAPAGCEPGPFRIGVVDVVLHPGDRVTLADGDRLAGSALLMHHGVENLMRMAGLSLPQAVTMATRNPARVGRISSRQRGLTTGERADVIEFRHNRQTDAIEILRTHLDGERVH